MVEGMLWCPSELAECNCDSSRPVSWRRQDHQLLTVPQPPLQGPEPLVVSGGRHRSPYRKMSLVGYSTGKAPQQEVAVNGLTLSRQFIILLQSQYDRINALHSKLENDAGLIKKNY